MANPDYSNTVLGPQGWPITKVYEKLVEVFGADGARVELANAFLEPDFGFICGRPVLTPRVRGAYFGASLGAIAEGRPVVPEPQTPEPGWREADPSFRHNHRIAVIGGMVKAVPRSERGQYQWSLAIWLDSARGRWPSVFGEGAQAKSVANQSAKGSRGRPPKEIKIAKSLIIEMYGKIPTEPECSTPDFFKRLKADPRYKAIKPPPSDDSFKRALGRKD